MAQYKKILVIKPSSLGDVVHSMPFLHALGTSYPEARIDWVISKGLEDLIEGHPLIGRAFVIHKDLWKNLSKAGSTLKEIRSLFRMLRHEQYDLAVDLQGLLRSGLITAATRAPERIGFAGAREGSRLFYTRKVEAGKDLHAVDRYLKIAAELGCSTEKIEFPFPLTAAEAAKAKDLKERLGAYAVLVPGARWKTKIWPAEKFGNVASGIPVSSVIIGGRAERHIAEEIVSAAGGKAVSLAGETTLKELIEVIRRSSVVITNDSGPMHIAAALQIPVVAIFGPTSAARTGPYGKGHIILQSRADCVPCYKRECSDMKCMQDISADTVLYEAATVLRREGR